MSGRLPVNSRTPRYFSNSKNNERRLTPGNSSSSKFVIEITEPDSVGGTPIARRGDSYTPTHSLMKTANSPKVIATRPTEFSKESPDRVRHLKEVNLAVHPLLLPQVLIRSSTFLPNLPSPRGFQTLRLEQTRGVWLLSSTRSVL